MEAKHEANKTKEETEKQAELEREVSVWVFVCNGCEGSCCGFNAFWKNTKDVQISHDRKTTAFFNKCKKIHVQVLSGMLGNIFFNYLFLPDDQAVGRNAQTDVKNWIRDERVPQKTGSNKLDLIESVIIVCIPSWLVFCLWVTW